MAKKKIVKKTIKKSSKPVVKKSEKLKRKVLKTRVKKLKQENGKKNKKDVRNLIILSVIFLIFLSIVLFYKFQFDKNIAKIGDKVSIKYAVFDEENKLIDTNIEEVAKENNVFNSNKGYSYYEFRIGAGQAIEGVDEAIRGMKIGEEKEFLIPPEKAYGPYIENKTLEIPSTKEINLYDRITRDINLHPEELVNIFNLTTVKVNDALPASDKYAWPIKVIKIGDTDITGRLLPKEGDYYVEGSFNYSIARIDGGEMIIKRRIINKVMPSKFGNLLLKEEGGKIISRYNITIGKRVSVDKILYYISKSNGKFIILDQNNPLAGKTLKFRMILVDIK